MAKQNKKLWQWLGIFQVVVQKASHPFSASLLKCQVISLGCIHHMHVCFDYLLIFICMHTDFKPQSVDNFRKYSYTDAYPVRPMSVCYYFDLLVLSSALCKSRTSA